MIDYLFAICYTTIVKDIVYTKQALKTLRSMQKARAVAIIAKINAYANDESVDAIKMQGSNYFRIRVGSWRIIIDDNGTIVSVLKIGPRGDVYNN